MADNDVETPTARERAKTERQDALVRAASALFARKGFGAVSIEELGAAVGVSGPALYRHFAGKQALLGEILVGASERLLEGGRTAAGRKAGWGCQHCRIAGIAGAGDSPTRSPPLWTIRPDRPT